jgi:hypothetical protein
LSGSWSGYVENFAFNDQSDAVTLTFRNAPPGGQVVFGDSPPLAPPSDPNVGYPGGLQLEPMHPSTSAPYPGFAFTLMKTSLDGQRLQFDIAPTELWTTWCQLQTPILDEVNADMSYGCVHNWATSFGGPQGCSQTDPATRQQVPIDCGKLALCQFGSGVCGCTAQGCAVTLVTSVHFDLVMAAAKADGSVKGLDGSLHNVHLTKR